MDNDHLKVVENEGYVEAPGAEVFKSAIRKSSRLQSKNSCSNSKQSSKVSLCKESSISESKNQEKKKHQFPYRNEINGVYSANTTSTKSSTVVPSFQYHVRAEEGIHLVVDLNLKRSDWLKSMEKEICVCQNHSKPAFESFRKEVECLGNRINLKVSSPDKTSASDTTMNSYVQNNFSIRSIIREDGNALPSVVGKEVTTESGSKQCWSKVDQNSELVPESFENSVEVQLSDFSSQQKGSLCSRTGKTCSKNLLNSSSEVIQEAGDDHSRSTVKNEERINSAEGIEVSGREENAYVISTSDDGPKRKKRYYKSDNMHAQSHERVLRSTQIFGGKIIECDDGVTIWRSSRLHSKADRLLE